MSNPLRILEALDHNLRSASELTLFGRAALALGFPNPPSTFHSTHDVDAILSFDWLSAADENIDFWLAQQQTNVDLEKDGLYLTHLFRESEVILRPDWLRHRVRIALPLSKLNVFRPAAIDLILTKMARGDEQDMQDIRFILEREKLTENQLLSAFSNARVPEVPEIAELFLKAQPKVIHLLAQLL
jgi:hypothetical protein